MALDPDDRRRLRRLQHLLEQLEQNGPRRVDGPLEELPRLYRHATSCLAHLEAKAADPLLRNTVRDLLGRTQVILYAPAASGRGDLFLRAWRFFTRDCPRTIRSEWKLLLASTIVFYGLATLAFVGVARDLDLAFSLLDPSVVLGEIEQLEETPDGEPFRGNFTFGLGESPQTAGWIMVHNMGVGTLFFASSLIPPLYLLILTQNALMLGTYTAVAGHWDQAGAISSVLWCHGAIELQSILLAGLAGLVAVRAFIAPGARTRRHALALESQRAWRILAPVFPMLFVAGMIEGYVSPHASPEVRLGVAVGTGLLLLGWLCLGGRSPDAPVSRPLAAPPARPR